jgi:hypothetical protein
MDKFKHWISTRLNWLDNNVPGIVVTDLPKNISVGTISIFPNPAATNIHISTRSDIQHLIIYTPGSAQILSWTDATFHQKTIDISDFPPGVYIITAILENGTYCNDKFIKID